MCISIKGRFDYLLLITFGIFSMTYSASLFHFCSFNERDFAMDDMNDDDLDDDSEEEESDDDDTDEAFLDDEDIESFDNE